MTALRNIMVTLATVWCAGFAHGQSAAEPLELTPATQYDPQFVDLRVVDEGVEDVGALNGSLRSFSPGLHQSNDFSRVYQVPGSTNFMRAQGALYAVYPRSVYASNGSAAVPPGTVFYIGDPSPFEQFPGDPNATQQQPAVISGEPLRWNTRVRLSNNDNVASTESSPTDQRRQQFEQTGEDAHRMQPIPSTQRTLPTDEIAPDIIEIDDYRQRRLAELMQRAAEAAQAAE